MRDRASYITILKIFQCRLLEQISSEFSLLAQITIASKSYQGVLKVDKFDML